MHPAQPAPFQRGEEFAGVSFHLCKSGVVHHRTAVGADRRGVLWLRPQGWRVRRSRRLVGLAESFTTDTFDSLIKDAVKSGTPIRSGADDFIE